MKKKRILVADDDPSITDALQLMLELEGYEVDIETNGENIYKMKTNYDVLLLDIWMSGHDGRDICRFLKQNPGTRNIPVIMFSASRDVIDSARKAGADDFIEKPFERKELLQKIAAFTS